MKKFLLLVVMVVLGVAAMAQSTNKISYQAVIRDGQNRLAVDQNITVKVTIGSYEETFNATTNSNGLVSLQIPNTNVSAFEAIDWSTATITTEVTVGSDVMTNTVPVTAVPYALDVNTNSATVGAIYDKIKADSTTLHDAMIDTAGNIRTDMNTMKNDLQTNIDTASSQIRTDMNTMKNDLQTNIDTASTQIRTDMNTMKTNLQNNIDTVSANIRGDLETVAFTGSYNDLSDLPTIPVVNDGHLNIKSGSKSLGTTFTANASADVDIDIAPAFEDYATKTKVQNDSIAISSNLSDTAQVLRNLINNLPKEHVIKVTATDDQTTFTLASEPKANYLVKMFINGVLVGDNDGTDAVITVSGTTATYNPANNGDKALVAGDKIVIYYFY